MIYEMIYETEMGKLVLALFYSFVSVGLIVHVAEKVTSPIWYPIKKYFSN